MTQRILIVDDHRLFADGLGLMLSQMDSGLQVDTEYNARMLLSKIELLQAYDLLLIDLDMPSLSGLDFLRAINNRNENLAVLVVSGSENLPDVEQALRLGAKGFAPKSLPSNEMLSAIKQVLDKKLYLPKHIAESIDWLACRNNNKAPQKVNIDSVNLRSRQLEVLALMRDGHTNAQIGTILGISESGVKSHISILFDALKTRNRTAAVKIGVELGLI